MDLQKLVQALKVWNKIKHRNVMQLFGICYVTGEHLALVLPFYEHGSLLVFLTDEETASKLDKMKLVSLPCRAFISRPLMAHSS
jgi:hypothetical protein